MNPKTFKTGVCSTAQESYFCTIWELHLSSFIIFQNRQSLQWKRVHLLLSCFLLILLLTEHHEFLWNKTLKVKHKLPPLGLINNKLSFHMFTEHITTKKRDACYNEMSNFTIQDLHCRRTQQHDLLTFSSPTKLNSAPLFIQNQIWNPPLLSLF